MLTGGSEQACEVDLLSPFYGWGMQGTQVKNLPRLRQQEVAGIKLKVGPPGSRIHVLTLIYCAITSICYHFPTN